KLKNNGGSTMSNEDKEEQAAKLQQLFLEVNNHETDEKKEKVTEEELIEIDVLNLPPRSEVHPATNVRLQIDFRRPSWSFIAIIVLLIIIGCIVDFLFGEQIMELFI